MLVGVLQIYTWKCCTWKWSLICLKENLRIFNKLGKKDLAARGTFQDAVRTNTAAKLEGSQENTVSQEDGRETKWRREKIRHKTADRNTGKRAKYKHRLEEICRNCRIHIQGWWEKEQTPNLVCCSTIWLNGMLKEKVYSQNATFYSKTGFRNTSSSAPTQWFLHISHISPPPQLHCLENFILFPVSFLKGYI